MSSNPGGSLHTLNDPGAEQYIEETLENDEHSHLLPLGEEQQNYTSIPLPPDIITQPPDIYTQQYFIQRSTDDIEKSVYQREGDGRLEMSPVRRMFCLLVLFDVLLTILMWIIYVQLADCDLTCDIKKEVMHYEIGTSFFDIVVLAGVRSLILMFVYSFICRSSKWYAVAFTTTLTTMFLMTKVFAVKSFAKAQPLNYLLVIFSFVICWCEAWHFDFHVIPKELSEHEKRLASSLPAVVGSSNHRYNPRSLPRSHSKGAGATSAFYTPYAGSIYRARSPSVGSESTLSNVSAELNEVEENDHQFIRASKDTVHMVFRMLYITDGWTIEREERDNICVSTRQFDGVGKVYKLETVIDVPSKLLNKLFWEDVDSQPAWNPSVRESQIVRRINKKTDIVYSVAAEAGAGIIASRDFVSLRRRKKKGSLTLLCAASIETDLIPVKRSIIRGHNGPGGWVLRDMVGEPNKTEFVWLLNTELKGWLPQRLVEQSISGVMVDTARDIRKHVSTLPQE